MHGQMIAGRGAVAQPLLMEVIREITVHDLMRLGDAPKTAVPVLQKLRATHHRQAKLLAEGKSVKDVAIIVGCTPQRLTQLQVDPTFSQLVSFYQDQINSSMIEDAARLKDKLVDIGEMAVDEIRDRLENDGQRRSMPTHILKQIAEMALDRTVAPPKTSMPNTNVPPSITISFGTPVRQEQTAEVIIEGKVESQD